jgi:hypothetical protein
MTDQIEEMLVLPLNTPTGVITTLSFQTKFCVDYCKTKIRSFPERTFPSDALAYSGAGIMAPWISSIGFSPSIPAEVLACSGTGIMAPWISYNRRAAIHSIRRSCLLQDWIESWHRGYHLYLLLHPFQQTQQGNSRELCRKPLVFLRSISLLSGPDYTLSSHLNK